MTPHEPLRSTLIRTLSVAVALGLVVSLLRGGIRLWPLATLLVLWFSLGGHWVELFFLRVVSPRLGAERGIQVIVRLAVWFVGGSILTDGIIATSNALHGFLRAGYQDCWKGGAMFVGIELLVHLVSRIRGVPNFYDGRG